MGLQACCEALLANLADHRGIAAGIDLGVGPAMGLGQRHLLHARLVRQHRVPAKVSVCTAGLVEKLTVIEVGVRSATPVQRDLGITCQGGQQQWLDAGVTCASGEQHQGPLVLVLPGAGTHRPFKFQAVTCLQGWQQAFGKQAAAYLADVKHQLPLVPGGQVGDGKTAAIAVVEPKAYVLASPYRQRLCRLQHQFDDIGAQFAFAMNLRVDFQRLGFQGPAGDFQAHVAAGVALAQQHFVGGEGVAGRGHVCRPLLVPILPRHHLDLARPAGAAAA
ncbi:hypothetical protein D3C72_540290 [compost metagenome]